MTAIQALLIALLYCVVRGSVCIFYTVPLYCCYFMGFMVGLILGDPVTGIVIGAGIQLINLGWTGYGGAVPSDILLASCAGTAFAIVGGLDVASAVALSIPFGAIGVAVANGFKAINSAVWCPYVDRQVETLNFRGINLGCTLYPFLTCCLIILPWFFPMLYWGADAVADSVAQFPVWLSSSLSAMGKLLPALGFGTYLNVIATKKTIPFFVIGFFLMKYLNLPILGMAVIGFMITYLGLYFDKDIEIFN